MKESDDSGFKKRHLQILPASLEVPAEHPLQIHLCQCLNFQPALKI